MPCPVHPEGREGRVGRGRGWERIAGDRGRRGGAGSGSERHRRPVHQHVQEEVEEVRAVHLGLGGLRHSLRECFRRRISRGRPTEPLEEYMRHLRGLGGIGWGGLEEAYQAWKDVGRIWGGGGSVARQPKLEESEGEVHRERAEFF